MKIVKITALWCNSCLVMNRIFNDFIKDKDIEVLSLDYDMDDIEEYNVGDILPVFIFVKDGKEVKRLVGEHKKEEFIKAVEKVL